MDASVDIVLGVKFKALRVPPRAPVVKLKNAVVKVPNPGC
jgi:hypothetical protein